MNKKKLKEVEIKKLIIQWRLTPEMGLRGEIKHRYTYEDIVDKLKTEYGVEHNRRLVMKVCVSHGIEESFEQLSREGLIKVEELEGSKDVLNENLKMLQDIFEKDLKIVSAITKINSNYLNSIIDKIKKEEPVEKEEMKLLLSIGDVSSNRIMKLFEFLLLNKEKEKEKEVNIIFSNGIDFLEEEVEENGE